MEISAAIPDGQCPQRGSVEGPVSLLHAHQVLLVWSANQNLGSDSLAVSCGLEGIW